MKLAALIPALDPDETLLTLAGELVRHGLPVLVVNDGSASGQAVFRSLSAMENVTVLNHSVNLGKGRALKTGIRYLSEHGYEAVVTADADGQHAPEDILRIAALLEQHPDTLLLGVRDLSAMPGRSRAGNRLTRFLFRALYGLRLRDTQSGLRGIPLGDKAQELLALPGERYEFENAMLLSAEDMFSGGLREIPIQTIYLPDGVSHFRPLRDGAKIYAMFFHRLPKFLISSFSAFLVDYLLFNAVYYCIVGDAVVATVLARLVSGTWNYCLNRCWVFANAPGKLCARDYCKLALCLLALNSALMALLVEALGLPAFAAKLLVECALYALSFTVQHRLTMGSLRKTSS